MCTSLFARLATAAAVIAAPVVGHLADASASAPSVVGAAPTADDGGYFTFSSDGGVDTYGDAVFRGSMGGIPLNRPVVGGTVDPATGGYWEVASDGGIFSFDASFYGSTGGIVLNQPIVAMASTPDGGGYWLVASDGGVFAFGDAGFHGSLGGLTLSAPIVGIAATPDGNGYWMVGRDGAVYAFGDAGWYGNAQVGLTPVVGIAADYTRHGYAIETVAGGTALIGDTAGQPDNGTGQSTAAVIPQSDGRFLSVTTTGQAFTLSGTPWDATVGVSSDYTVAFQVPDGSPARWACSSYPITVSYNPAGAPAAPDVAADVAKVSKAMGVPFRIVTGPADIEISWVANADMPRTGDVVGALGLTEWGQLIGNAQLTSMAVLLNARIGDDPTVATDVLLHELGHEGLNDDPASITNEEEGVSLPVSQSYELGRFGAGDLAGLRLEGAGSPCL